MSILFMVSVGEPAHASFTITDEKKLGKEFYEKLKSKQLLSSDPSVNDYVNKIGQRLLIHVGKSPFTYTFSVIKSNGINAFATPGGYIYVYEGLIKIAENESQLAGVLAHEISHVDSRHIAETIEKSQKLSIASLAAILAGAFLGAGGEATAAISSFSLATAAHLNLKYTRENEEEADRKGMRYLVNSGYDGRGMLDFLKIMRRYEYFSNSIPSYFLTHPGTGERITYLDALLQTTYTKRGKNDIYGELRHIKTTLVLKENNLNESLKYFENELKKNPDDVDFTYGLAVIQGKLGHIDESLKNYSRALQMSPNDHKILRDLGILYFKRGSINDAIQALKKAYDIDPNDSETILYLGRSYEAVNDTMSALGLYEKYRIDNPDDSDIYYNLAMAYGKTDNPGASHYNFGIYFKKKNKATSALFHFKAAQKYFPPHTEKGKIIQEEIDSVSHK